MTREEIQNLARETHTPAGEAVALPPIEVDPSMPSREYIPLPGGWEVQTKGNGSSYRVLDTKSGERHAILGCEPSWVQDFITRMAKEVHAACSSPPTPDADAIRRAALEEWRDARQMVFDLGAQSKVSPEQWDRLARAEHALMDIARALATRPAARP